MCRSGCVWEGRGGWHEKERGVDEWRRRTMPVTAPGAAAAADNDDDGARVTDSDVRAVVVDGLCGGALCGQ